LQHDFRVIDAGALVTFVGSDPLHRQRE
jgi:hypothetical protein